LVEEKTNNWPDIITGFKEASCCLAKKKRVELFSTNSRAVTHQGLLFPEVTADPHLPSLRKARMTTMLDLLNPSSHV